MNFDLSQDQQMMRDNFARFLDEQCSMSRVRAAQPSGFDPVLWTGLAELGTFSLRVPEAPWAGVEKKPKFAYGPMAKLFSSEKFLKDSADLLNLTAPYSLSKRKGPAGFLNQCYRHAQGTTIYGGTSEIHRSMIAERALGLPRTRA